MLTWLCVLHGSALPGCRASCGRELCAERMPARIQFQAVASARDPAGVPVLEACITNLFCVTMNISTIYAM